MVNARDLAEELRTQIASHFEWLFARANGRTFPLRRTEIDISYVSGKVFLGVFDDSGYAVSRVRSASLEDGTLVLELTSEAGNVRESASLTPRPSARELGQSVELARLQRANQIAAAMTESAPRYRLTRVAISIENGRLAQIFARDPIGTEIALLCDVTGTMTHEAVMTSAAIWFEKLRSRKKPIGALWIAAERKQAKNLQKLFGLFNRNVAARFRLFEISNAAEKPALKELKPPRSLWRERKKKISLPDQLATSDTARRILEQAPHATDVIYSKQGETIRYLGLPFARVRTVASRERAWFGLDRDRRMLTEDSWSDFRELLADLELYRSAATPNRRHELYRAAPEAWLESILRRNIKLLDSNLILSPIYNQFRAAADKIDLLAIRRDGRLVIIELKTSPDRETVFQAADYWRKIELQRRSGELKKIRAFGDVEILDIPALVYVVAPALSFHPDFELFARMLSREIEMWRFELHENWRAAVRVLTRRSESEFS